MYKKGFSLVGIAVAGSLLAACGQDGDSANNTNGNGETLQVSASFYPMYEFATQVGGDRANVEMVLSSNQDAHSFEPSAQDVAKANDSDVFVYSSDEMEFWVPGLLNSIENDDLVVARTADGVEAAIESDHDHAHDDEDHDHEDEGHDHAHDEEDHNHGEEDHNHDEDEGHDRAHDDEEHNHDEDSGHGHGRIIGATGHYHTGDTASLQADIDSEETITWVVVESGEETQTELSASDTFEHTLANGSATVYFVADGEQSESVNLHVDDHDGSDPHVWLDPVYAKDQVNIILDAFIEADPEGEDEYRANAEEFIQQLEALHQDYEEAFEGAENRNFVVQHEAFSYLANRYNLNQISIGGLSTEVEPSPSRLVEVGSLVEEHDVPVIYYQDGSDSGVAQTVADETDTEIAVLYDLEILSSEIEEQGLGYIEAMRQNLEQLKLSIN